MTDVLRDQINSARRQGYSNTQIVDYLKSTDPRITEALSAGHSADEIADYLAPPPTTGETVAREAGIAARGVTESWAPAAVGAVGGVALGAMTGVAAPIAVPVGAIAGSLAVPAADVLVSGYNKLTDSNVRLPSQAISEMIPGPRAETPAERVLQTTAGAVGATGPSIAAGRALAQAPGVSRGAQAIGQQLAERPIAQTITAPVSAAVGQTVTEATDNPFLGLAAGTLTSMAGGMARTKREAVPTSEDLLATAKKNYDVLDQSGFQLETNQFKTQMAALPAKLRKDLGYVESAYPKVASAFKELTSDAPKDIAEIQALRKVVAGAAKSGDAQERAIAIRLLDEFDDYVMNAPTSAVVAGDKEAMNAWKTARDNYSRFKKSEIFSDMIENADVSPGSKEANLTRQLAALAKNQKRMRFFTPDEQQAIRDAAKGGKIQASLRLIAKFKPMTPAAAIFTAVSPFGAYTAGAGLTADELAQMNRVRQLNQLGQQMRLGRQPQVISGPLANQPLFGSRGALNMLSPTLQSENALAR